MLNPARCLLRLTADAAEGLLRLIDFNSLSGADELWHWSDRLAEAEAEQEVHEATAVAPQVSADSATAVHPPCSADPPGVEQGGLQLTRDDLLYAAACIRGYTLGWKSLDPEFHNTLADRLTIAASSMK